MSRKSWKPVRVDGANSGASSEVSVVELAITTPEAKEALEKIVQADSTLSLKESKDTISPQILILEIGEDPGKTFDLVRTVLATAKAPEVFLTSSQTDSKILLEALRVGMKEFLPQPIQQEEVEGAFERFRSRKQEGSQSGQSKKRSGKILAVLGGKGGVGTTSFAVNLAACLQNFEHKPTVVLVDVNQHGGDVPMYLDLLPQRSFRDIGDASRLDLAFLATLLMKHDSGLSILPCGYDALSSGRLSPESVEPTLQLLQGMYDFVVVDCGHVLDSPRKKALEMSSHVLLVSQLLVPIIHRTKRILELLRSSGLPSGKIKLIVNRYVSQEKDLLAETEEVLKHKAFGLVRNDFVTMANAINSGRPVIMDAPKSPLAKSYIALADLFQEGPAVKKGGSLLGSWFKSRKGKPTEPQVAPA